MSQILIMIDNIVDSGQRIELRGLVSESSHTVMALFTVDLLKEESHMAWEDGFSLMVISTKVN